MNKTLLSTALLSLLCSTSHADTTPPSTTTTSTVSTTTSAPTTLTTPAATAPTTTVTTTTSAPTPQAVIDCKYRLPAETTTVEQSLILTWAKQAAVQSFDFDPATIDTELLTLKPCYTDQGWQGFNDALKKSGNIDAIKSQHLTVSSQVDGDVMINPVKDNQWKVSVPLQVVYQNDKEKLTQLLGVDLVIGRKISGDLGIMQMIATPRQAPTGEPVPANPVEQPMPTTDNAVQTQQVPTPATTQPANAPASQNAPAVNPTAAAATGTTATMPTPGATVNPTPGSNQPATPAQP